MPPERSRREHRVTLSYGLDTVDLVDVDELLEQLLAAVPRMGPVLASAPGRVDVVVAVEAPSIVEALRRAELAVSPRLSGELLEASIEVLETAG